MSESHRITEVLVYRPPAGWRVIDGDDPRQLVSVPLLEDDEAPHPEWSPASFVILEYPTTASDVGLARYLSTRVRQGHADYPPTKSHIAEDAVCARWTDGVNDVVTWLTARRGGVLFELTRDPWRVEGDALDMAGTHLSGVTWRVPSTTAAGQPTVRFYSVTGEHGELSNFAAYAIVLGKKRWPTSEHYFQAQKFDDPKDREDVRRATTPAEAARRGRDRKRKLRRDWESVKDSVMRTAVEAKFRQHPELAALLLATGDAWIVEHTERDAYWGDGGDGTGRNMLGRILMEVRAVLRSEAPEVRG